MPEGGNPEPWAPEDEPDTGDSASGSDKDRTIKRKISSLLDEITKKN